MDDTMADQVLTISTPRGDARAVVSVADQPVNVLILGHGAGGGIGARDLACLAESLPTHGISVVRVEQPWRVAGRKVAPAPAVLDECWMAVVTDLENSGLLTGGPVVLGGRSAGARVACRTASQLGAAGVLALSFPLHPPGKPERSRAEELAAPGVPLLVIQGDRDAFGRPDEFPEGVDLAVVPDADHGLRVPAKASLSQDEAMSLVAEAVLEWVTREI